MSGKNQDRNTLLEILDELNHPTGLSEMPRRIDLCRQALQIISRETQPALWGMLQDDLASSLAETPMGLRAENLEQAIHHYQQALEVRTRQNSPEEWASTQNNLANTYRDRIYGEQAENIELAIHHYQQALEVRYNQVNTERWAMIQYNS
jgi:tetratricopeptide (TPR) repeat protein